MSVQTWVVICNWSDNSQNDPFHVNLKAHLILLSVLTILKQACEATGHFEINFL